MTDITIPPAALEAGAKALCNEQRLFWPDLTKDEHDIIRGEARAAFVAMVKAWPYHYGPPDRLILPMETEKTDDKA